MTEKGNKASFLARLCLLGLLFQVNGVGHWSGGHAIVSPDEAAEHAAHCHGDNSSCGGGGAGASVVADPGKAFHLPAPPQTVATPMVAGDSRTTRPALDLPDPPPRFTASNESSFRA